MEKMAETYQGLFRGASWLKVRVPFGKMHVYVKCRIREHVKPQASVPEFAILGYASYIFPNSKRKPAGGTHLLEFNSSIQRRRAHAMIESYIADEQLRLHYSSRRGVSDAGQVAFPPLMR